MKKQLIVINVRNESQFGSLASHVRAINARELFKYSFRLVYLNLTLLMIIMFPHLLSIFRGYYPHLRLSITMIKSNNILEISLINVKT